MQIAVDGPAGSGKSTLAKLLAKELGFKYLDTGAMYRAVTLAALRSGVPADRDEEGLAELAKRVVIDFDGLRVLLDGEDVTEEIRGEAVTGSVSEVSANEAVRAEMTKRQRELTRSGSIVMDGRDIGTVVLPDAEVKFFLDATPECRARRRAVDDGIDLNDAAAMAELVEKIRARDKKDSEREVSPLRRADDAHWIMTDEMGIDEVLARLLEIIKESAS